MLLGIVTGEENELRIETLKTLAILVKPLGGREAHESAILGTAIYSKIFALALGWGGKDNGLGLLKYLESKVHIKELLLINRIYRPCHYTLSSMTNKKVKKLFTFQTSATSKRTRTKCCNRLQQSSMFLKNCNLLSLPESCFPNTLPILARKTNLFWCVC